MRRFLTRLPPKSIRTVMSARAVSSNFRTTTSASSSRRQAKSIVCGCLQVSEFANKPSLLLLGKTAKNTVLRAFLKIKQMTVKWKQHLIILTGLLAFSIVIRLPWFFIDVIDPDEGIFILADQYLSQGHLPYTVVWDNKPPLGFVF